MVRTTLAPLASTPAAANGPAWSSPARIDSTPGRASASRRSSAPSVGPTALGASDIAAGTRLDDDLGRRRLRGLGAGHAWAFAAVSFSMPMWSITGSISRCSS